MGPPDGTCGAGRGGHARGVLQHGALALQVVLVHGALLLLLQAVLLVAALAGAAVLPRTRVTHDAWKSKHRRPW